MSRLVYNRFRNSRKGTLIMNENECLTGLSNEELEALAECMLAPVSQTRLDELLTLKNERRLTAVEEQELDRLLQQIDQLTILKTRARYTLNQQRLTAAGI